MNSSYCLIEVDKLSLKLSALALSDTFPSAIFLFILSLIACCIYGFLKLLKSDNQHISNIAENGESYKVLLNPSSLQTIDIIYFSLLTSIYFGFPKSVPTPKLS